MLAYLVEPCVECSKKSFCCTVPVLIHVCANYDIKNMLIECDEYEETK